MNIIEQMDYHFVVEAAIHSIVIVKTHGLATWNMTLRMIPMSRSRSRSKYGYTNRSRSGSRSMNMNIAMTLSMNMKLATMSIRSAIIRSRSKVATINRIPRKS